MLFFKYSLNLLNYNLSASYNCNGTKCIGRASTYIEYDNNKQTYIINKAKITKIHSLKYEEHYYVVENNIKLDIKNNIISTSIPKSKLI